MPLFVLPFCVLDARPQTCSYESKGSLTPDEKGNLQMAVKAEEKKTAIYNFFKQGDENPEIRGNRFQLLKAVIKFAGYPETMAVNNLWYDALELLCREGVLVYTEEFGYALVGARENVMADEAVLPLPDLDVREVPLLISEENVSEAATLTQCLFAMGKAFTELAIMVDERFTSLERELHELKAGSGIKRAHQEILRALETLQKKGGK